MARTPRTAPIPAWMFLGSSIPGLRDHDPAPTTRSSGLFGGLGRKR